MRLNLQDVDLNHTIIRHCCFTVIFFFNNKTSCVHSSTINASESLSDSSSCIAANSLKIDNRRSSFLHKNSNCNMNL